MEPKEKASENTSGVWSVFRCVWAYPRRADVRWGAKSLWDMGLPSDTGRCPACPVQAPGVRPRSEPLRGGSVSVRTPCNPESEETDVPSVYRRSGRWWASWRRSNGQRVRRPLPGVTSEREAEKLAATFEGESYPSDLWHRGAIMSKQLDAKLLTIEELAIKLGCSVSTVRRAVGRRPHGDERRRALLVVREGAVAHRAGAHRRRVHGATGRTR